jgi:26S proteasome regulatory subunit N11
MLMNLHKKSWDYGLSLQNFETHCKENEDVVQEMLNLAKLYQKVIFLF